MSYSTSHGDKKRSLFRAITAIIGCVVVAAQCSKASAAEDWWFDVEIIVFKRDISLTDIPEKFPLVAPSAPSEQDVDLLSAYLKPNLSYLLQSLPVCHQSNEVSYVWGPAVLVEETADDVISDAPAADNQSDAEQEIAGSTPEIEESADLFAPLMDDVAAASQTNPQLDVADTSPQEPDTDAPQISPEGAQFERFFSAYLTEFQDNWQFPEQIPCAYPDQLSLLKSPFEEPVAEVMVPSVPVNIDGIEWTDLNRPYLLPQSSLTLSTLFADLSRQRNLLPMLHVGWRQEVLFGENKTPSFRLFAGKNFADKYSASGELLADIPDQPSAHEYIERAEDPIDAPETDSEPQHLAEESLFEQISKVLADDSPITFDETSDNISAGTGDQQTLSALWELDGKVKVYLQNVGKTPYLHIDTNLEYRAPLFVHSKQMKLAMHDHSSAIVVGHTNQPNYLQSIQFSQLRRVISKQLHYFDHPLFGMLVHITRYKRPLPEPEDLSELEGQADLEAKGKEN